MLTYISKHAADKGRAIRTRENTPTTGRTDLMIGAAWNKAQGDHPLDIDLHLALCDARGRALDLVYHQKQISSCGAAYLTGDNIDGEGPGWDEAIGIDWQNLHTRIALVEVFLVIDKAEEREQHLGMATGGYVSAINSQATELTHRQLTRHSHQTGLIVARARREDEWDVRFPFEGVSFAEIAASLGIAA